uniref:3D domain-containing protein n=1 Tax=candidate division WWE3 bacterium TaxID=2053526 RepID=A0A831Z158_UNCKA
MLDKKNQNKSETLAVAAVQSILMLGIAAAIFFLFGAGFAVPPKTAPVLSAASNCPGTKLNYPREIRETFPNGQTVSFRYNCIQTGFVASSYDGRCEGCSGRTHFTDEPVTWGVCAVDQNVIPPHSVFYVPGYGPCKAADKGGKVKGKKIDLGFEDTASGWWSRRYTDILTLVK